MFETIRKAVIPATLLVAALSGGPSAANPNPSYTELVGDIRNVFAEIRSAKQLSAEDFDRAQRAAAAWFYVNPCEGDARKLGGVGAPGALSEVHPAKSTDAAMLEMIAIMHGVNLGRKPSPELCRFAQETAAPNALGWRR